jgi:hypothetical protein
MFIICTFHVYNIYSQSLNTSSLVTIDPPSALSPRVLNALKADPRTVDLRALAPHFYNLGARILELFEEEEMIEVLSDTFKARAALIADQAHNPRGALGEGADFMRGLDENERQCKCWASFAIRLLTTVKCFVQHTIAQRAYGRGWQI